MTPGTSSEAAYGPLGRRARKALATRHALFQAGLAAFEHRPLGMVSVLDLTEATDVAKGVFYLHFRGKDEYLLALQEFVQQAFLEAVRPKLEACRTRRARIDAVARHYHGRIAEAPRECRFWLRMSSYFGDEIGEPEQLTCGRQEYLRQLAALLAAVPPEEVDARELRIATVVDGTGWGLISQVVQLDLAVVAEAEFVSAVSSCVRALERG